VTTRLYFLFVLLAAVPGAVLAQGSRSAPAQTPAAAPANPISGSQSKMYIMLSSMVVAGAEKMPEENYSLKPTPEVRSFGQLVGHLADSQYLFCSSVRGETKHPSGTEKSKTSKTELIAALKNAVAYCSNARDWF
jgi:DinB superfamily